MKGENFVEKYNVCDLYIVKVSDHYFICENIEGKYREVFNGYIFSNILEKNIKSYAKFYSLDLMESFLFGASLTLTKNQLVEKYTELNSDKKNKRNNNSNVHFKGQNKSFDVLSVLAKNSFESAVEESSNNISSEFKKTIVKKIKK